MLRDAAIRICIIAGLVGFLALIVYIGVENHRVMLEWCEAHPTETYHYYRSAYECETVLGRP